MYTFFGILISLIDEKIINKVAAVAAGHCHVQGEGSIANQSGGHAATRATVRPPPSVKTSAASASAFAPPGAVAKESGKGYLTLTSGLTRSKRTYPGFEGHLTGSADPQLLYP